MSPASGEPVDPRQISLTIDHLHQFAYCPRRMHLMYVDGRWDDNVYTEEGRAVHQRTDAEVDPLPDPIPTEGEDPPQIARSVSLDSDTLQLTGKLDLVETQGDEAIPVDTKRGHVPDNPLQSYEPERVQLMAQALLLREHGFRCVRGMLYFAASRKRVSVALDDALEARTRFLLSEAHAAMRRTELPPPLEDSPKCNGCSLAGICLPDETLALRSEEKSPDVRRLYPARDDALPLYVQEQGARVGKSGESLNVSKGKQDLGGFPLKDVSQVVLCGNIGISAQCVHLLCERGIPVVHLSMGHWFYGITVGQGLRNAYDRAAQFAAAADAGRCLQFAKAIVKAKARNQRLLLRRNAAGLVHDALVSMARETQRIDPAESLESLLGVEGALASTYFRHWGALLKAREVGAQFQFTARNRRPPRDPVNAMLSFSYALLAKECAVALLSEGLDPWWGLYHQPRHGRPALALDLMEEFRPLVADSAVVSAVNTGMVVPGDFVTSTAGCAMKPTARKALIRAYEARLDQLITHPVFDYRCSWRAVVRLQARLLAKWLRGDIPAYQGIVTR